MKIRASKKYIQGIDMLVNNAQKFAEDMVSLPENKEVDQRFVKFAVDMWRAVENYRYILKRTDTDDEVILLADGEGNSGAFVNDDDTLGAFVARHFTKDNDIEIISKDEIDLVECFSGSLEDFLSDTDNEIVKLRNTKLYKCKIEFNNFECVIKVVM